MLIERLRARREWLVLIALAIAATWIWCLALKTEPRDLTAIFLDVGQGDCTLIRTPSGRTVLVDGGGRAEDSNSDRLGMTVVEPFLRCQGINRIDVVILSHPHDDHVQGLISVVRDFRIGAVLDPGIPHGSKAYQRFLETVRDRRIPYRQAVRGQVIDLGDGVRAQVLSPPPSTVAEADDANDASAVVRFTYGNHALLMTGDAGTAAESEIIASGVDVRSDVLKVAHHGSSYSTGDEWLSAVSPRIAVISVGRGNPFGHPSSETLARLAAHQAKSYRTDECGAVTVRIAADGLSVRTCIPAKAD